MRTQTVWLPQKLAQRHAGRARARFAPVFCASSIDFAPNAPGLRVIFGFQNSVSAPQARRTRTKCARKPFGCRKNSRKDTPAERARVLRRSARQALNLRRMRQVCASFLVSKTACRRRKRAELAPNVHANRLAAAKTRAKTRRPSARAFCAGFLRVKH